MCAMWDPTRPGAKFCEGCGTTLAAASQAMQPSIPATQLKEITYIPVVQLAKVVGAIAAVIFFIYGLFLALTIGVSIGSIPGFSGVSGVFAAILSDYPNANIWFYCRFRRNCYRSAYIQLDRTKNWRDSSQSQVELNVL